MQGGHAVAGGHQCGGRCIERRSLRALRDLVQVGVVHPQGFAVGHDGLGKRLGVVEAELLRAVEGKLPAAGFDGTGLVGVADGLGKAGGARAHGFEVLIQCGQAIGLCQAIAGHGGGQNSGSLEVAFGCQQKGGSDYCHG